MANDPNGYDYDFALLKLSESIRSSYRVGYICLPSDLQESFVGAHLIISGFGRQVPDDPSSLPTNLMATTTMIGVSNFECQLRYKVNVNVNITSNMLCAESPMYASDACRGDSGGYRSTYLHLTRDFSASYHSQESVQGGYIYL
jgi:hypothetical protein